MIAAVITAAGKGTRLNSNISKQFLHLYDKPILAYTIESFHKSKNVSEIFVTIAKEYLDFCKEEIIKKYRFTKVKKVVIGGETRQDSVYNALKSITENCLIVSVHDGVRPLITAEEIDYFINALVNLNKNDPEVKGVITAAPAYETVKKIDNNSIIDSTITRNLVCLAQTPQTFFYKDLLEAYKRADEENFTGTDDASLVERIGWKVKVIMGKHENIKITTPLDLFLAELIMERDGKNKK
ncbi:MAG: 2-C-methyl-D-erythritol 4-phosphate cytidylyltransferase [Actinobacteria bacterium]|nr:2-C-methyl-D-erythritol 4-phosphate cytidylyltransferase [Actinomycetota bacterium]